MSLHLGKLLQEGLSLIGIQASTTNKDQFYRIKFESFPVFISFIQEYFLPYHIETQDDQELSNDSASNLSDMAKYQIQFAVETLPEKLNDIDIMETIIEFTEKIGFNPIYHKTAGICTIDLPFEAVFILFIELIQKLYKGV